jgi:hypothetical protein
VAIFDHAHQSSVRDASLLDHFTGGQVLAHGLHRSGMPKLAQPNLPKLGQISCEPSRNVRKLRVCHA